MAEKAPVRNMRLEELMEAIGEMMVRKLAFVAKVGDPKALEEKLEGVEEGKKKLKVEILTIKEEYKRIKKQLEEVDNRKGDKI